ncbi:MAG TPA: iron-containing alcohol dehydrogenase [Caulobacteraceae bacterium]|nr:iron-containing alcohol dehydrogenase [Caulobacteraceae bacterium]
MITGSHRFPTMEEVVYGRPAAAAVAALADAFGAQRLLFVTTRSLDTPNGAVAGLKAALGARCVGVFSAIRAHSPREDVVACADAARAAGADLLVALGGGSVIDAVKVVQLCLWGDVRSVEGVGQLVGSRARDLKPGARMIALPTTLSAAEFTPFAGVTDTDRRAKEGYGHPMLAPRAVVLDPRLTLETPVGLWFSTGLKAVDHAVEQLCNPERAPYADALAEAGLKHLAAALPATKVSPEDLDARLDCQFGMWLAISGASAGRGLGASHAIGHTLGGGFGVPHGITSCVMLPAVLAWNATVNAERQAVVAALMGRPGASAAEAVRDLAQSLGLPTRLSEVGIGPAQFEAIGEATMHDRGVRSNPRPIAGPADIVEILKLAA